VHCGGREVPVGNVEVGGAHKSSVDALHE